MKKLLQSLILLTGAMFLTGMSGWTPAPSSGGGGISEIPDTLESIKITADSLYWTEAFGDRLSLSDVVYFVYYPDSSYEDPLYIGGGSYQFPGVSSCYTNVYVGSGYKITAAGMYLKVSSSRTFNFRVYDSPSLTGAVLFDSTITLGGSGNIQGVYWDPDTVQVWGDSICIEIEDDWGQTFTALYDSIYTARFYVKDFEGIYYLQPDITPWVLVEGVSTVPATTPVTLGEVSGVSGGFFNLGIYIPNLQVDTLSVATLQPSNVVGRGGPFNTEGVTTLSDTCWTSSGDMFVFVNGLLTEFVPTP